MATTPHVILLSGNPIYPQEMQSSEAITPGHLIEIATGALRKHAGADTNAAPWFANVVKTPDRADLLPPIDTPYQVGETVSWLACRPGDMVYAWIPANAAAIVAGDSLVSAGDGTLKKATAATAGTVGNSNSVVAQAAEAVNNSANASPVRLRVRAL